MSKKPTMREKFNKEYGEMDSTEIQKELLYQAFRSNSIAEKTNDNVRGLYTWLVVVPIIVGIILGIVLA
ncbi:MAG: hypothetical protein ABJJ25_15360 [Eudoraea sp.]|uniref:hypothetical protein n=1 Tax=Eudoraea sp. TaxID=1979955 RepID=UPI003264D7B7